MSEPTTLERLGAELAAVLLLLLPLIRMWLRERAQKYALTRGIQAGLDAGLIPEEAKELVRGEAVAAGVQKDLHAAVLKTRRLRPRTEPGASGAPTTPPEAPGEPGPAEARGTDAPA